MTAIFEQGKLAGLGCTGLGLLFMIVGMIGLLETVNLGGTMDFDCHMKSFKVGSTSEDFWDSGICNKLAIFFTSSTTSTTRRRGYTPPPPPTPAPCLPAGDYTKSSDGSTCPSGYAKITSSSADCRCAAAALYTAGSTTQSTMVYLYSGDFSYEKGCYYNSYNELGTTYKKVYFNPVLTGGSNGDPVCKKTTGGRRALRRSSSLSQRIISDCESGQQLSKAGFAMLFLGLLCSCGLLASLAKANGYANFPSPLGKQIPTVAIGGMSTVFLLIGVICAAEYPDKLFAWWVDLADMTSGILSYDKKIGWGMVMLILALLSVFAATVMAYVGIDANDDGDGTAPTVRAAVETPMGSPAGHQTTEPPGAVYQKNGTWYDANDNPIS